MERSKAWLGTKSAREIMVRNELGGNARGQILQGLWGNSEESLDSECDRKLTNILEEESNMIWCAFLKLNLFWNNYTFTCHCKK